ncbi:unnamed protein product [Protopolystoma xenopodis]|uniref:Uncharacterized protein n=1 Tax=Protopolystoma xenopodis TaxID=117903 RepID=A0A448X7N9_9PLAT|nr:unnamed protein product [Protopolystoma xenopodis]
MNLQSLRSVVQFVFPCHFDVLCPLLTMSTTNVQRIKDVSVFIGPNRLLFRPVFALNTVADFVASPASRAFFANAGLLVTHDGDGDGDGDGGSRGRDVVLRLAGRADGREGGRSRRDKTWQPGEWIHHEDEPTVGRTPSSVGRAAEPAQGRGTNPAYPHACRCPDDRQDGRSASPSQGCEWYSQPTRFLTRNSHICAPLCHSPPRNYDLGITLWGDICLVEDIISQLTDTMTKPRRINALLL